MSWVEELARQNGTKAAASAANVEVPSPPPVPPLPTPPPVAAPRRVCLGRRQDVSNPGISFTALEPVCGQPLRHLLGDQITFEKELVSCPRCLEAALAAPALAAATNVAPAAATSVDLPQPGPRPAGTVFPVPDGNVKDFLDSLLDVPALEGKLVELEGEAEAVRVLLQAALAREAKKQAMSEPGAAR